MGSRRRLTASFRLLQLRGKEVSELSTACSSSMFSWWSPCTREAQGPSFTTKEAYLSALSPSATCVCRCRPFSQLHASIVPSALRAASNPFYQFLLPPDVLVTSTASVAACMAASHLLACHDVHSLVDCFDLNTVGQHHMHLSHPNIYRYIQVFTG